MTHQAILEAVRGPWQLAVPPGLPPVLQELLVSALAKNPQDRWARQPDADQPIWLAPDWAVKAAFMWLDMPRLHSPVTSMS